MSTRFSITELMYIVLGGIPKLNNYFDDMRSVLVADNNKNLPIVSFCIDDMFSGFSTFETYYFLANELFPHFV